MSATLKHRITDGRELRVPLVFLSLPRDQVLETYQQKACDMVFLDTQHGPASDSDIIDFCRWSFAQAVPVLLRIRHPSESYLAGRYCDMGAAGILIPLVEDPETVREAVDAFYYPPLGKRSWGPLNAYRIEEHGGMGYASWWNDNGVLAIQLETVEGIQRCRELVLPGVDMVMFGGNDLQFSLDATPDTPWATVEECIDHVVTQLADLDVRVVASAMPFGELPGKASS